MDERTHREALIAQLKDELGPSLARQFLALADAAPIDDAAFRTAAFEYFDRHAAAKTNPDTYFNWIGQVALPRPETPLANTGLWEWALSIAHEWEESRSAHQHKGSGYYFAGMRSIALGDIDRGFLYMHQAAVEDTYPDRDRLPESPAGWFIALDASRADQAYHDWVSNHEVYLSGKLSAYRTAGRGALTLDELRSRYKTNGSLTDAATTLAHVIARLTRMESSKRLRILDNRFAALLLTQVALELCLAIEDVMHDRIVTGLALGGLASQFPQGHGISLTSDDVGRLNALASTPSGFDTVITELLFGGVVTGFGRTLTDREADLEIAVLVRNKSAHGLDRPEAAARLFDQITPRLFFALFMAIETLYP